MAEELKTYRRKISDDEASGRYIMILKNALNFFPKAGKNFKLVVKGNSNQKEVETTINAVECWCMGPNKPHYHYRIDARNFRDIFPLHFGKKISITKNSDDEYILS